MFVCGFGWPCDHLHIFHCLSRCCLLLLLFLPPSPLPPFYFNQPWVTTPLIPLPPSAPPSARVGTSCSRATPARSSTCPPPRFVRCSVFFFSLLLLFVAVFLHSSCSSCSSCSSSCSSCYSRTLLELLFPLITHRFPLYFPLVAFLSCRAILCPISLLSLFFFFLFFLGCRPASTVTPR